MTVQTEGTSILCYICGGEGKGFIDVFNHRDGHSTIDVQCDACNGHGTVDPAILSGGDLLDSIDEARNQLDNAKHAWWQARSRSNKEAFGPNHSKERHLAAVEIEDSAFKQVLSDHRDLEILLREKAYRER